VIDLFLYSSEARMKSSKRRLNTQKLKTDLDFAPDSGV